MTNFYTSCLKLKLILVGSIALSLGFVACKTGVDAPDNSIAGNWRISTEEFGMYYSGEKYNDFVDRPYDAYVRFRAKRAKGGDTLNIYRVEESYPSESVVPRARKYADEIKATYGSVGSHIDQAIIINVMFYEKNLANNQALVMTQPANAVAGTKGVSFQRYWKVWVYPDSVLDD